MHPKPQPPHKVQEAAASAYLEGSRRLGSRALRKRLLGVFGVHSEAESKNKDSRKDSEMRVALSFQGEP